jgi:hypothetical protein
LLDLTFIRMADIDFALAIFVAPFDPEAARPSLPWLLLALERLYWAASDHRRFGARLGVTGAGTGELDA